jgi:hypothetical protein
VPICETPGRAAKERASALQTLRPAWLLILGLVSTQRL